MNIPGLFSRKHAELKIVLVTLSVLILLPVMCLVVFASSGFALVSSALASVNPLTKIVEIFDANGNKVSELKLNTVWPTKGYTTDEFGAHDNYRRELRLGPHTGLDIANESGLIGEPVTPFLEGEVIDVNSVNRGACGLFVKIKHVHNITSLYCHLSSVLVTEGQMVKPGDIIGLMGSTGISTGAHLHFQVNIQDLPVDPRLFLVGVPERSTVRVVVPQF